MIAHIDAHRGRFGVEPIEVVHVSLLEPGIYSPKVQLARSVHRWLIAVRTIVPPDVPGQAPPDSGIRMLLARPWRPVEPFVLALKHRVQQEANVTLLSFDSEYEAIDQVYVLKVHV